MLAWTYVLSARWIETIPGTCKMLYTDASAIYDDGYERHQSDDQIVNVELENTEAKEAR